MEEAAEVGIADPEEEVGTTTTALEEGMTTTEAGVTAIATASGGITVAVVPNGNAAEAEADHVPSADHAVGTGAGAVPAIEATAAPAIEATAAMEADP